MPAINRLEFEQALWKQGLHYVMGLDEVGRGCLAGPVVSAGVVFNPQTVFPDGLMDSKKMTLKARREWSEWIKEHALFFHIDYATPLEVDKLNVLKASITSMIRCVDNALNKHLTIDHLLVDGNRFSSTLIPHSCIVKGDDRSYSIAAASVLAKVERDDYMQALHNQYPMYGWDTNVGYPTKKHKEAIQEFGITEYHRKSFKLKP